MAFEIALSPQAIGDLRRLSAHDRAAVRDAIKVHLRHEPAKVSKSRIKRLRGASGPQYRLCVGDVRVFYDIAQTEVQVLAIVAKADADRWLAAEGLPDEEDPSLGSEG